MTHNTLGLILFILSSCSNLYAQRFSQSHSQTPAPIEILIDIHELEQTTQTNSTIPLNREKLESTKNQPIAHILDKMTLAVSRQNGSAGQQTSLSF